MRKGETLGVVGESGSGKTTLGLALLRLISSDGPIVFLGKNIQGLRFKAMRPFRRDMQIVFQDPFGSLSPRMSVGDIVAEGLSVHQRALSASRARSARRSRRCRDVGLDPATRFRYPHEFSGGQRQRISIARAVVLEPNFVVLDEPTSALDMLFQAQMVDLLRELQRKRDLTYMFISHDLRVVASLASHLIVMRHGKVVEEGPAVGAVQESEDRLHPRAVRRRVPAGSRAGRRRRGMKGPDAQLIRLMAVISLPAALMRAMASRGVFDRGRHVMRVGVNDGVGIAHDRDVAFPENQIAALQFGRFGAGAQILAEPVLLHVAVARAADARGI